MANISTYTATPCGPSSGPTYEVPVSQVDIVPTDELLAVRISVNPDTYTCCTVNRNQVNSTPASQVKGAVASGFKLNACTACNDHWS